jgi:hypothetical protein
MDTRTRIENLLPGDIIGVTDRSFLSAGIKGKTWGWRYCLSQDKDSHIVVIGETKRGPIRFIEMESSGIQDNSPNEYDLMPGREHLVWVGRHASMTPEIRKAFNDYLVNVLLEKHIEYGFLQIADFIFREFGIHLHDRPNHEICSMLPAVVCDKIGIVRPQVMKSDFVAPMHWQCFYPTMQNISPMVIGKDVIKTIS